MANEFKVRKGLVVNGSGSVILDVQGSQGQLFSVTDQLSGSLFSVNDISGVPVLEAFSDSTVKIGQYLAEAIIVSGSTARITGSMSLAGFSTGSVLFAGTGGAISQNNSNFFWDNTNGRLGIGTNAPAYKLDVSGDARINNTTQFIFDTSRLQISTTGVSGFYGNNFINWSSSTNYTLQRQGGTVGIRINSTDNVSIGATTDGGQKFQVYGDTLLNGLTTLRGTTNNDTTTIFRIEQANQNGRFLVNAAAQVQIVGDPYTLSDVLLSIGRNSFNPTSGTATHTSLAITPTINQTGGANGVTRGLYVNPTLTAAADFRAIEWSNNTATAPSASWGLYGAGTAPNLLNGRLIVNSSITSSQILISGSGSQRLTVQGSGSSILTVDGALGRLFSVDDAASGSLFSVNTISGLPIMEAFSDNTVRIGQFGQRALFVSQSRVGIGKEDNLNATLDVSGSMALTGSFNHQGNYTTTGVITAQTLVISTISSSVVYSSGSNVFGNSLSNTQVLTGSVSITGSLTSNGDVVIRGSGTTSATTALTVQNSGSANLFTVRNDGVSTITGTLQLNAIANFGSVGCYPSNNGGYAFGSGARALRYETVFDSFVTSPHSFAYNLFSAHLGTATEINHSNFYGQFNPTSGTKVFNIITIAPAINQTGGANGITRGIYVNPTLTSAADWRSIEWSNNAATAPSASWGLYGAGSAPNYLSGSLGIGTTAIGSNALVVNGNANFGGTNGLTWDSINNRLGIGINTPSARLEISSSATFATGITLNNSGSIGYIWGDGSSMNMRAGGTHGIQISGGSASILPTTVTTGQFRIDLQLLTSLPIYTYFGDPNTGIGRSAEDVLTFFAGGERARLTGGNLLLGTTTDDTFNRLQVSGSARISQALTASQALISGSGTQRLTVVGSGSAQPLFTVQGSQGELFSIVDSLSGSLFSVNDQSGLPIMEVFSDNTILMGNYLDPMLLTTTKTGSAAGINTIYSLPTSSYDTVYIDYTIRSGSNARAGNFMAMWSGTSVNFTDNSITEFGSTSAFTFGAHISGANMVVTGSAPTAGWTIKTIIKAI